MLFQLNYLKLNFEIFFATVLYKEGIYNIYVYTQEKLLQLCKTTINIERPLFLSRNTVSGTFRVLVQKV